MLAREGDGRAREGGMASKFMGWWLRVRVAGSASFAPWEGGRDGEMGGYGYERVNEMCSFCSFSVSLWVLSRWFCSSSAFFFLARKVGVGDVSNVLEGGRTVLLTRSLS